MSNEMKELNLPAIADLMQFRETLPILVTDMNGDSVEVVAHTNLHAALGVATRADDWFKRLVAKYGFEAGEDFVTAQEIIKGRVVTTYYMTLDMAKEACMVNTGEIGRGARKYFILAEKVARKYALDALQAEVKQANAKAISQKRQADHFNALLQENTDNLNKMGTDSARLAEASRKADLLPQTQASLGRANAFATMAWRQASDALGDLKRGKQKEAMRRLEEVNAAYGEYDDMRCDEFPWCG